MLKFGEAYVGDTWEEEIAVLRAEHYIPQCSGYEMHHGHEGPDPEHQRQLMRGGCHGNDGLGHAATSPRRDSTGETGGSGLGDGLLAVALVWVQRRTIRQAAHLDDSNSTPRRPPARVRDCDGGRRSACNCHRRLDPVGCGDLEASRSSSRAAVAPIESSGIPTPRERSPGRGAGDKACARRSPGGRAPAE